jgi:hypothetical protein
MIGGATVAANDAGWTLADLKSFCHESLAPSGNVDPLGLFRDHDHLPGGIEVTVASYAPQGRGCPHAP